jgi:hypothetical protein
MVLWIALKYSHQMNILMWESDQTKFFLWTSTHRIFERHKLGPNLLWPTTHGLIPLASVAVWCLPLTWGFGLITSQLQQLVQCCCLNQLPTLEQPSHFCSIVHDVILVVVMMMYMVLANFCLSTLVFMCSIIVSKLLVNRIIVILS